MKRGISYILFVFSFSFLVSACDSSIDDTEMIDYQYEYSPFQVGNYKEYEINIRDSSFSTDIDTTFYLKEVVSQKLIDILTREFVIKRYFKANLDDEYTLKELSKVELSTHTLITVYDNIRYVNLKFPVYEGLTWDGNAENNENENDFSIDSLAFTFTLNDTTSFDNVLFVNQEEKKTSIDTILSYERYAKDIGLIQKEERNITNTINENFEFVIESAYIYSQNLIQSGTE